MDETAGSRSSCERLVASLLAARVLQVRTIGFARLWHTFEVYPSFVVSSITPESYAGKRVEKIGRIRTKKRRFFSMPTWRASEGREIHIQDRA